MQNVLERRWVETWLEGTTFNYVHLFVQSVESWNMTQKTFPPRSVTVSQPPLAVGTAPLPQCFIHLPLPRIFPWKYKSSNGTQVPRTYSDQLVSRQAVQQSIAMATNQNDSGSVAIDDNSPVPPVLETSGMKRFEKKLETKIHGNYEGGN